jgi:hypothetical protein
MQKILKRIAFTATLVLAIVCLCSFFAACGEKEDTSVYTVTVVYPDGTAVNGQTEGTAGSDDKKVMVQICDATNEARCYKLQQLGTDGVVTVDAAALEEALTGATSFSVHLNGVPTGYTYDNSKILTTTSHSVKITLEKA